MAQPIEEFTNLLERISESTAGVAAGAGVRLAIPSADTLPPTVTVITPNGGEVLQGNQQFVIQWQSSDNVGLVAHDVKFSRDGGTSFTDIATNLPGQAQSFPWTVPSQPTSQGVIRVVARDAAGNQGGDRSDGVFSIQAMSDTVPPTVTVTSPNGGEILQPNQQFLIQWQSSDNVAVVAHDVKFSRDGGATFTDIITNLSGATKSFLWMVPSQSTTQGVIRVVARDAAGNQGGDRSDGVFSIQAMSDTVPPTVTVTSPNGGEVLQPNQQFLIQWQSSDNVAVVAHDVKFSRDNGATFTDIITNLSGTTKSFLWTVPSQSTTQGVIRVVARDAAGNQGGDRSDGVFSIQAMSDTVPPTVTVTSPNGGEILQPNQQFLIQWQSSDNVAVVAHDVKFSRDGGATFTDIITNLSGTTKSFLWMVPSQSTTQGVIRVVARDAAGNQGGDRSDGVFSIQAMMDTIPPTVTVTSPNGGEVLQPNQQFLIQWQSSDNVAVVAHDVKFSRDGGATFTDIITNLSGATKSFLWMVPSQSTTQGVIRVVARDAAGNQGGDRSDGVFSIQAMSDTIPPTVTVTSPNGGEILQPNQQFLIQWQSSDNVAVVAHDVKFSRDGGATFTDIITNLSGTTKSFLWMVPSQSTTQGVIRVVARDAAGNQGADNSNTPFSIQAMSDTVPPTVTVTSPNGGEILQPNQQFLIQWQSSDNIAVVAHDVRFSRDGGATFTDIATNLPGSAQSFTWTVPSQGTNQGLIRVVARDAAGNQGADNSNTPFSIQAMMDTIPPTVTVTSPNGGEVLQPNQQFLIQWQSSDNIAVVAHDVKFSRDGGATFTDIATNLPGSAQSFAWTVPSQGTNQGLIRVVARDAAGNQGADNSNAQFSIQAMMDTIPPTVTVTSPNGGEVLQPNQQFLIQWQSSDNIAVVAHDVKFSRDGGATFTDIITNLPGSAQSFAWTVPSQGTNQGLIRVVARDAAGNQGADNSNAIFAVSTVAGPDPMIGSLVPAQIVRPREGQPPSISRVVVNGSSLPLSASQYQIKDFGGLPVNGVRILSASGAPERVVLEVELVAAGAAVIASLVATGSSGASASRRIEIQTNACGARPCLQHFFLTIRQAPPVQPTPFKVVLSYADTVRPFVKPTIVHLNTADPSKPAIVIDFTKPLPPGVVVDEDNGTISFFIDNSGAANQAQAQCFIQSFYASSGDVCGLPDFGLGALSTSFYQSNGDVVCYVVLSPPVTINANTPRSVNIAQSLAVHSLAFQPVDFQGVEIDGCPSNEGASLTYQFIHRQTGHFVQGVATGFGKSSRILVSDVSTDYSFGAVGGFGRDFARPLHLYLYSIRNGIRGDVALTNSAAQLARRDVIANPGADVQNLFLLTVTGFVLYNAGDVGTISPATLPKHFGVINPNCTFSLAAGVPSPIYVFSSSDTSLDLADPMNARTPDFPAVYFKLTTSGNVGTDPDARDDILFTTPIFTGNADQAQSFFSVDTVNAKFDRLEVPAPGQIPVGANPIFDATVWTRSTVPDFRELQAQHFMSADNRTDTQEPGRLSSAGYVSHLTADGANQGEQVNFKARGMSTFILKRDGRVINQGTLSVISSKPDLVAGVSAGDYRFTLTHPGINVGGTLFPVVTKSSFKVGPGLDGSPPALRKLQLLVNGRVANAIDPAATPNVVLFNVDPVAGNGGNDALQTLTLAVSRDGNPFTRLQLTPMTNGDRQAALPAPGNAARFDFKITATDLASNRLVTRFSLPVAGGRGPGAALAPDTSFDVSPASLTFSLALGGIAPGQILNVGSADEPIDFTVQSDAPWLRVSPAGGTTPSALSVSVDGRGLAAGVYQGRLTMTADDSSTALPVTVPVTLNVTGRKLPPIGIRRGDDPPINDTL